MVAVVNVEGIKSGDLTLDGPTLARIFLGEIKRWNDAAIRKLNPNAKLPSQAILVVRRSDGSGTTFAFTDYLAKVSADWKSKIGSTVAVEWPTGIGANGNEGVAASVARTRGAIGYVEYAYATQHRLTYTKLINKDGQAVAPTTAAFAAAAANADWEAAPGFGVILTNQGGAATWPIAAATFVLMHKQPNDPAASRCRVEIFRLGLRQGRQDGRGARLRADARQRGRRRAEPLGFADQGPRRQAGLRHLAVSSSRRDVRLPCVVAAAVGRLAVSLGREGAADSVRSPPPCGEGLGVGVVVIALRMSSSTPSMFVSTSLFQ